MSYLVGNVVDALGIENARIYLVALGSENFTNDPPTKIFGDSALHYEGILNKRFNDVGLGKMVTIAKEQGSTGELPNGHVVHKMISHKSITEEQYNIIANNFHKHRPC